MPKPNAHTLEPFYQDCLDDIARRTGIASGTVLLGAMPNQSAHHIRNFVVAYYRGMAPPRQIQTRMIAQ